MKECRKIFKGVSSSFRNFHWLYFDQGNSNKKLDGAGDKIKEQKKKVNRRTQYIINEKSHNMYEYDILKAFLLGGVGNLQNQHSKKHGKHNPDTLKYLLHV